MQAKRNGIVMWLLAVGFLPAVFGFYHAACASAEVINDFNVGITVQKGGAILITETIQYDFGSNQKHGIFRDIPLTAPNGPDLDIKVLEVKNERREAYPYAVSIASGVFRVKIGDPNVVISGAKTYIISYRAHNAIRSFADHDELYWNVTGDQWPVAIRAAAASVVLPEPALSAMRMDCFSGPRGSKEKSCTFNQDSQNVHYSATRSLGAYEGLTLVLGMPPGYIQNTYVPAQSSAAPKRSRNASAFFILPVFIAIFVLGIGKSFALRLRTKKPRPVIPAELKGQPVIVAYNPPDGLPPIDVGTLLDRRVDITDISSVILDLAVRGYLKIRYTVEVIRFWPDKKDFELTKLKDGSNLVHPADKTMFELLFNGRDSVKLSDLKQSKKTFQADIKKIQKDTEAHLHREGYFDQAAAKKSKKLKVYLSVAIVLSFASFFVGGVLLGSFVFVPYVLFLGAVVALSWTMARLAHALAPRGVSTLAKILGFKEFLELTEKDKLELLDAPDLKPEMFEKFLPYAMVLGVQDSWAQKFEGIYDTIPNWYEDSTAAGFNSAMLTQNLILFNSSFNQVFTITSGNSSSGFGGGGFSGGGSGGGGGGSW